jgi:acetyltransferase-like isoleucine patch superfamily enzyme
MEFSDEKQTKVRSMNDYFCHTNAIVEKGAMIGARTRIWAFAHILPGAMIGEDCNVCDHTFIEGDVRMGDRVTVKSGVYLWDGMTVENDVFLGPNVCFTNDKSPRSRKYPSVFPRMLLKKGCSLGGNSTILPGLTIGQWAMVGAGAVVTRNVPDYGLVIGNPARLVGWVCRCGNKLPDPINQLIACGCGQRFEQISDNEIRNLATEADVTPAL